MRKILAAVMAAATFVSAINFSAFAADIMKDSGASSIFTSSFPLTVYGERTVANTDVVKPGSSVYILVPKSPFAGVSSGVLYDLTNKDKFTVSAKATEGAKYVKAISVVEKTAVNATLLDAPYTKVSQNRETFIKVDLKDDYTDAERKVVLEVSVKAKGATNTGTLKAKTVPFYVGNATTTYDSYANGTKGQIYKPVANEENEIIWSDNNYDVARLTFTADSDVAKSYPKLNTKWVESDYAEYFVDQDAFLFEFVSNPYISSTSRAVLEIYTPYFNHDTDEISVDGADVTIYEVTEEGLVDVTGQFTYGENDDGDYVFTTKTRKLGTYIFCEKELSEEVLDDEPADSVGTEKVPADTGR